MSPDLQTFSDKLTQSYKELGLAKSVAQTLVYLTVCEPARQTATTIQAQLALSTGSVSNALNILLGLGLLVRDKPLGSRQYYYELDSDAWERSIRQQFTMIDQLVDLTKQGTALAPRNTRLATMLDIYRYFNEESKELMRRYERRERG